MADSAGQDSEHPRYWGLYETRRSQKRRMVIWALQDCLCCWCGKSISYQKATEEHLIPIKLGGLTHWNNLAVACEPCNGKRGNAKPWNGQPYGMDRVCALLWEARLRSELITRHSFHTLDSIRAFSRHIDDARCLEQELDKLEVWHSQFVPLNRE